MQAAGYDMAGRGGAGCGLRAHISSPRRALGGIRNQSEVGLFARKSFVKLITRSVLTFHYDIFANILIL